MNSRWPYLVSYAAAAMAALFAVAVRWLLNPILDHQLLFIANYAAIAAVIWFAGWKPAILTAAVGFVAAYAVFVETDSQSPLSLASHGGIAALAIYSVSCSVVIGLAGGMRAAQHRAQAALLELRAKRRQLETEIEERRNAETSLRQKEAELQLITAQTPLLLTRCNKDGIYVFVNRACAEFLKQRPEDIVGRSVSAVLGEAALSVIAPYIERVLKGEQVEFESEIPYLHPGLRRMHVIYIPDRNSDGQVIGWLASISDVTEHRRTEEALRQNEAQFASEARALARLNELSSRLWNVRDLHEGLDEMLAATIELLGADMGNVQILHTEDEVLRIAAQRGFEREFLDFFSEVSTTDDSACGRALRSGTRIVIEDIEADAPYAPLLPIARTAGYRAVQSTPLIGRGGSPLGMLSTHFKTAHRPSEQDLRRLDLYVRQAADFIERCRTDEVLRETDLRKDEFLATLAHELRNPLAPIRYAVEILRLQGAHGRDLPWGLETIERQMQQMTRLIDDLMDISRITRGHFELRRERVPLAAVLRSALETSQPLIDGANDELSVELPDEAIYLDADLTRLAQVFSNLLNNAVKYSNRGARIALSAERRSDEVVVSVRDSGIGIPDEMLPRIFDMFTQVDRSLERSRGGLGIGLTLARRLVEMHGGTISARSDGRDKGSEFFVRLPIAAAPGAPKPDAASADGIANTAAVDRILIVDDNEDSATSLAKIFALLGCETRNASDGEEGLRIAAEFRPKIVLLDIGLPKLNGYEVARRIRQQHWGTEIVLIAVTGWGQSADKQRAFDAGFDHHLVKPVDPRVLTNLCIGLPPSANRTGSA